MRSDIKLAGSKIRPVCLYLCLQIVVQHYLYADKDEYASPQNGCPASYGFAELLSYAKPDYAYEKSHCPGDRSAEKSCFEIVLSDSQAY